MTTDAEESIVSDLYVAQEPTSHSKTVDVSDRVHWKISMEEEMNGLREFESQSLVIASCTTKKVIDYCWVSNLQLTTKKQSQEYKVRIVAKGFHLKSGSTFAKRLSL